MTAAARAPGAPVSMPPHPDRVVGVSGVAFVAFNCIVGVGIFSLPGLVAGVLGPAAIVAYVVCAVLIGLVGLCFAEAGSRVSGSGGLYAYASAAFGPVIGGVAAAVRQCHNCYHRLSAVYPRAGRVARRGCVRAGDGGDLWRARQTGGAMSANDNHRKRRFVGSGLPHPTISVQATGDRVGQSPALRRIVKS